MADENYKRKLTAILGADVAGYSRLMGDDEVATVSTLKSYRELITEKVQSFNGRVVDSPGDNILSEFRSIVDAVKCAVAIQEGLRAQNEKLPENRKMNFRIGVNLGDVIQDGDRIYGDGVNIAARIEGLAKPGEVAISGTAFDNIRNKLKVGLEFVGEHQVKNIAQPVRVYRVLTDPASSGKIIGEPEGDQSTMPKTILAVAVVILLVAAAYLYIANEPTEEISKKEPERPSIAVLPFSNMSDDPQQEYFSDGMTDDLITDLSKVAGLMVISRNSTFTYKGKPVQIKSVAQELGVKYVLEGSVRKVGDQIRINAQLIDAEKDHHVWAERYDGQMDDVFDLQDRITQQIVTALAVNLTANEKGGQKTKETKNIQAYDAFLKGWSYFLQQTREEVPKAIPHLKKAIEIDPEYSGAYAALAYVYWRSMDQGWRKQLEVSIAAARLLPSNYLDKAMKRPNSTAYLLAAEISERNFLLDEALSYAQKAVALTPSDPWALLVLGKMLTKHGRCEEGLLYLQKSLDHDPQNPAQVWQNQAWAESCLGNYEKAVSLGERVREFNPTTTSIGAILSISYVNIGQQQKAEEALTHYKKGWPKWLPPTIPLVMKFINVVDPQNSMTFVKSMVKAGLPAEPSDYVKPWMLERLKDAEIKELLLGNKIKGLGLYSGKQWSWNISTEGTFQTKGGNFGEETGSFTIENDFFIINLPKNTEGLDNKGPVFKNTDGSPDKSNEYIFASVWALMPFSVEN
jgi:TolB-like protein/class 3 adenylate cyclase/Flp pilus assembly protein TadD